MFPSEQDRSHNKLWSEEREVEAPGLKPQPASADAPDEREQSRHDAEPERPARVPGPVPSAEDDGGQRGHDPRVPSKGSFRRNSPERVAGAIPRWTSSSEGLDTKNAQAAIATKASEKNTAPIRTRKPNQTLADLYPQIIARFEKNSRHLRTPEL